MIVVVVMIVVPRQGLRRKSDMLCLVKRFTVTAALARPASELEESRDTSGCGGDCASSSASRGVTLSATVDCDIETGAVAVVAFRIRSASSLVAA